MTRRYLVSPQVLALGAGSVCAPALAGRRADAYGLCQFVRRGVGDLLEEGLLRSVHGADRDPDQDRAGRFFAKLKAQVQTRNYEWNVINLGDVEYGQAVLEGLLEKVDKTAAKTDQLPPHMVREYGITSYSLGTNLVYRKDKFPNGGPQSWADFWDVKKFPGPRCMYDRSFTCLAFALLADGVPADKLYPMDIDRAFRKMSELKPHIKVWWREGSQSQQLIRDGEVDMIAMWSARAVDLIERQGAARAGLERRRNLQRQSAGAEGRSATPRRPGSSAISSRRPSRRRTSRCCCPTGLPIPAPAR